MEEQTLSAGMRIGEAAEWLGVSVETLRRWDRDGRIALVRTSGGQRLVSRDDVARLMVERRKNSERPVVAHSARNRFAGVVTRIEKDRVAAVVEIQAGPHRLVSLLTAEAVDELDLKVGDEAIAVVKATNVSIEIASSRRDKRA
jgi:molybdopterin-binding protein